MKQKKKDFLFKQIKMSVKTIAVGEVFGSFNADNNIYEFIPNSSNNQKRRLKAKIVSMAVALIFFYGIKRENSCDSDMKISYGKKFTKREKEKEKLYVSMSFSINPATLKEQIEKNSKSVHGLGKIEKKTSEDLERKIKEILDKGLF